MPEMGSALEGSDLRVAAAARAIGGFEGCAGPPTPRHLEMARLAIAAADAAVAPNRAPSIHIDGLALPGHF